MAKTKDKIPAKVRQQREAAEALKGNGEAADILKQLEDEEREAERQFREQQRAKREKALEKVLEPLRTRREELDQTIRDAEAEQEDIDRQIAKLTGQTVKGKRGGAEGGGKRLGKADKERLTAEALSLLSRTKEGLSRSQLANNLQVAPAQAATILKALKADGKAKVEGTKAAARYFAA